MVNNFENLKNSIRSIAKRCKSVSYSTALVVSFAMLGASAFSQENILTGKEINDKATNLEETLKNVRAKNNKKLKGARLELIQLMEQGDQVVKSPWSSWQFGLNYLFDSYNGSYKGRNDKNLKYPYEGIFARSNDKIIRSVAENSSQYSKLKFNSIFGSALSSDREGLSKNYGIDLTKNTLEPMIDIEVNVGIRPRTFSDSKIKVDLPTITVTKGSVPTMTLDNRETIEKPEIDSITLKMDLPQPNTKPYNNFDFIANPRRIRYIWFGGSPKYEGVQENYEYILGVNPDTGEPFPNVDVKNETFEPKPDWIAIHDVWDLRVEDSTFILNDKAVAFSLESWHSPKIAYKNTKVIIKGDDNSVFYLYPGGPIATVQVYGNYDSWQ